MTGERSSPKFKKKDTGPLAFYLFDSATNSFALKGEAYRESFNGFLFENFHKIPPAEERVSKRGSEDLIKSFFRFY